MRPTFGSAEPTATGFWARVGTPDRRAPARGLGRSPRCAARGRLPRPAPARRRRPVRPRTPTPRTSTRSSARRCSPTHGLADSSQHRSMVVANADQRRRGRGRRWRASTGIGEPSPSRSSRTASRFIAGHRSTPTPTARGRVRHRRRRRATRCTPVAGADALVGGGDGDLPRHQGRLQPRQQGDHPARAGRGAPDPDGCCCGRSSAPLMLIATVVLSFGAALGHLARWSSSYVFGFAGADPSFPLFVVRVPGRPGHRLQHLPDDPGPRGDAARTAPGGAR